MRNLMLLTVAVLALAACSTEKVEPLKSPCVGLDDSPCGPKRAPSGNWVQGRILQA